MTLTTDSVTLNDAHRRYDVQTILDDLSPADGSESFGVLLRPAFHGETLLSYHTKAGTVTASGYARSLWYLLAELRDVQLTTKERLLEKYRGAVAPPATIARWSQTAEAGTATANQAEDLRAAFHQAMSERSNIGADGISVLGFASEGGAERRLEAWSPRPGSKTHRFVHLIYDLARQSLSSTDVEERLEELHGYLALGLPWKVISSVPLVIRIFGSLSEAYIPELRLALEELPAGEPVVLDLTRLGGMGTLLHPVWRKWLQGRSNVSWVVGERAAFHLDCIGVPPAAQHRTLGAALGCP